MKASDIMTPSPCYCSPSDSLEQVAQLMRDNDCGAVPVIEDERIIGIVTDRDLAVRALAHGMSADAKVAKFFTRDPHCCTADDDIRDVEKTMANNQIRRVPIVNEEGRCVGIVAQADLARASLDGSRITEHEVAIVVERVSAPGAPSFDRIGSPIAEQRL
jgi:CBS domain-containing protein